MSDTEATAICIDLGDQCYALSHLLKDHGLALAELAALVRTHAQPGIVWLRNRSLQEQLQHRGLVALSGALTSHGRNIATEAHALWRCCTCGDPCFTMWEHVEGMARPWADCAGCDPPQWER